MIREGKSTGSTGRVLPKQCSSRGINTARRTEDLRPLHIFHLEAEIIDSLAGCGVPRWVQEE